MQDSIVSARVRLGLYVKRVENGKVVQTTIANICQQILKKQNSFVFNKSLKFGFLRICSERLLGARVPPPPQVLWFGQKVEVGKGEGKETFSDRLFKMAKVGLPLPFTLHPRLKDGTVAEREGGRTL